MDVSVIVPFYNNVQWLYQAVNSINESTELQYEIIIINDGSKESIDVSKFQAKENLYIFSQKNSGAGAARNTGISKAVGEYVAFLDSDDLFIKNKLTIQLNYMKKEGLVWSHTNYYEFSQNQKQKLIDVSSFKNSIFPYCLAYNPIATPTVMIKREILNDLKYRFSEKMKFGQDGYLWTKIGHDYKLGTLEKPLSKVRMRGSNTYLKAKNHLYVKNNMYDLIIKNPSYSKNVPLFLKVIFLISKINYKIVSAIFKSNLDGKSAEYMSRFLYFPEYFMLKIYKKVSEKGESKNGF